jgi:crotonobetainyl-CoA:carnitine CoA-transferase CaiB-like acyl-CoA transferase
MNLSPPLSGLRVIELGTWVAVPAAATMLGDWGATVIKAEPPRGDPLRSLRDTGFSSEEPSFNSVFQGENYSKHSMTFDLKDSLDRERLLHLTVGADVFMTNLRTASLQRFGLTYRHLASLNPRLVYGHLTGYGKTGSDRDRPGFDYAAFWARTGLLTSMGEPGTKPPIPRPGVGDHVAALALCSGILAALLHRSSSGLGQEIHVSLMNAGLWANAMDSHLRFPSGVPQARVAEPNPLFAPYQTADSRWIFLMIGQPERDWVKVCDVVGLDPTDERFSTPERRVANSKALEGILEAAFRGEGLLTWAPRLDGANLTWGPCQTMEEALRDTQVTANCCRREISGDHFIVGHPVELSTRHVIARAQGAPQLGQHNGLDWNDLCGLAATRQDIQ